MSLANLIGSAERLAGRNRDFDLLVAQHFGRPWYCYTHNVSRVIEITESELPGWRWIIDSDFDRGPPYAAQVKKRGDTWEQAKRTYAPTPAIALLLATMHAIQSNCFKAGMSAGVSDAQ